MAITTHTMIVELSHELVVSFMRWLFHEATTSFSLLALSTPHHQKSYVALHGTTYEAVDLYQCIYSYKSRSCDLVSSYISYCNWVCKSKENGMTSAANRPCVCLFSSCVCVHQGESRQVFVINSFFWVRWKYAIIIFKVWKYAIGISLTGGCHHSHWHAGQDGISPI
jgi:hypothetical protein